MASMLSHFLNVVQGPWTMDGNYTVKAKVANTIHTGMGDLKAGRVCHVALESGERVFKTGVHDSGVSMFFFPISSADLLDGRGDPAADGDAYVGFGTEDGVAVAIPATSGYELMSSEYVTGESYPPNTPLTALADDSDVDGGKLEPGTLFQEACCGVVSQGVIPSGYGGGIMGLCFHAVYAPKLLKATVQAILA